jgi:hypothetical protein
MDVWSRVSFWTPLIAALARFGLDDFILDA